MKDRDESADWSHESFVFDAVFSDPVGGKRQFLQKAREEAGYAEVLCFVGISSAVISGDPVSIG